VLLVITAAAGLSYGWGIGNFPLEPFYAAAARSMGGNWKDFFFGAVDPAGTASLDKLPGAIWLQALSVRLFGFHYWSVALPQAIVGVLTVLVLYRVVRRLAGAKAGLVAALILAASPVTALLNRGNVSDSLLILLTVLAADATARAVTTGRLRTLVLAGLWVGLAFQTKMVQAWLIIPALFAAYVVAAPAPLRRRLGHVVVAGVVTVIVSLSWMSVVAAVPGHDRPFVDGTTDDSIYVQVFVYNGWTRIGIHADADKIARGAQPFLVAAQKTTTDVGTFRIKASVNRLLVGPFGRDDAWLLPAALLALLAVALARRFESRRDPIRVAVIMWGGWLVVLFAFFSGGTAINSYYTAALIPAVAALCATGLALAWRTRAASRMARVLLLVVVPVTTVYALYLVPAGSGIRWWLVPVAAAVCIVAELALIVSVRLSEPGRPGGGIAFSVAAVSMLLVPAVTTGAVVGIGLGSFSTPYQSAVATNGGTTSVQRYQARNAHDATFYAHDYRGPPIIAAVDTAALASPYIMISGREFLPIGGYGGNNPSPSLATLRHLIDEGQVRLFIVPDEPAGTDPRMTWIRSHCQGEYVEPYSPHVTLRNYICSPQSTSQPLSASRPAG
jgi:4-amino-4-deoxy-L-arabinose transferase-like glycosyltransferase